MATATSNSAEQMGTDLMNTILGLYTNSIGRLAEAQKQTLDLARLQNADLIVAGKKITQTAPGTQAATFFDLAASTFGQYVDLRKGAIDLALEQSHSLAGLAKERFTSVSSATESVWAIVQDTVERAAATQKNAIEFSATQTRTVLDAFKQQAGVAGTPVEAAAESIQRGFDNMVETQKDILNIATKRTTKASA